MGLNASASGGQNFAPPPAGTFPARCVQVIDLGTQHSDFYNKDQKKVLIGWELPTEISDDDEPYLVWKRYTLSIHEKAVLGQHLSAWRGKPFTEAELANFDLRNVIGAPCMLTTQHKPGDGGKVYCNVVSVTGVPKGMTVPAQVHPSIVFDIESWEQAVFDSFRDGLKATISSSPEAAARLANAPKPPAAGGVPAYIDKFADESIPF